MLSTSSWETALWKPCWPWTVLVTNVNHKTAFNTSYEFWDISRRFQFLLSAWLSFFVDNCFWLLSHESFQSGCSLLEPTSHNAVYWYGDGVFSSPTWEDASFFPWFLFPAPWRSSKVYMESREIDGTTSLGLFSHFLIRIWEERLFCKPNLEGPTRLEWA